MYSAGLNRRDTAQRVIVAGIQSVYKRACELDAFDLVMVDEAHLIPPKGMACIGSSWPTPGSSIRTCASSGLPRRRFG
jgi:hypothetical protein